MASNFRKLVSPEGLHLGHELVPASWQALLVASFRHVCLFPHSLSTYLLCTGPLWWPESGAILTQVRVEGQTEARWKGKWPRGKPGKFLEGEG